MKRNLYLYALVVFPLACAGSEPPPAPPPPPPPPPVAQVEEPPAPPPAAEPTPEEKAQAEAAAKLEQDIAEMEAKATQEAKRWTPAMHEEAKQLAAGPYWSVRAAYAKLAQSNHRVPGHSERDQYRHPLETLEFFGLKPDMTVLEYGPGEGWYTELLAPLLAARGKLIVTSSDPKGPATERATMYGRRFQLFTEKAPELYGKIQTVMVDAKKPELGLDGNVDMALVIRGMHGWKRNGVVEPWLAEIHQALKPGGVLGIVQHRAKPDADPVQSAERGYLPEPWVIEQVESAGFKLSKKSEINKNEKDTTDHPEGVWALPPTLRLGDKDRDKYLAIGESDRMTLRFVKAPKP